MRNLANSCFVRIRGVLQMVYPSLLYDGCIKHSIMFNYVNFCLSLSHSVFRKPFSFNYHYYLVVDLFDLNSAIEPFDLHYCTFNYSP